MITCIDCILSNLVNCAYVTYISNGWLSIPIALLRIKIKASNNKRYSLLYLKHDFLKRYVFENIVYVLQLRSYGTIFIAIDNNNFLF